MFRAGRLLAQRIADRLTPETTGRLLVLAGVSDDPDEDGETALLRVIKSSPGAVSLSTMLAEIGKLTTIASFGLPDTLFAGVAPPVLKEWRDQAMTESPSHTRSHPPELTIALLAALLYCRRREITDALVNLLLSTVHRIGARAERRVSRELVSAFKRVQGKEGLLFQVAEASLARPDDPVRTVVFPVVGEDNLRNLVAEFKSSGPAWRRTVQTTYRASYTNHYRSGLIRLLEVLEFRSEASHQPVLDALALVRRYAGASSLTYYADGETIPAHEGLAGEWQELAWRTDVRGRRRVLRTVYEIRTFEALCAQLRCKGIWVAGAGEFRNPDEDLVTDLPSGAPSTTPSCASHWTRACSSASYAEMRREMQALNDALDGEGLPWREIADRGRHGAIRLTPLEALPEPVNLGRL